MTSEQDPARWPTWLAILQRDDGDMVIATQQHPADGIEAEAWLIELAEARPTGDLVYLARMAGSFWSSLDRAALDER